MPSNPLLRNTAPTFFAGGDGRNFVDFDTSPTARGDASAYAMAVQPDGRLVLAGSVDDGAGNYRFAVGRFESDGAIDTSFGDRGRAFADFGSLAEGASDVAIQTDGAIVVCGRVQGQLPGEDGFTVVRFTAAGTLDTSFGSGGRVTVTAGAGHTLGEATALAIHPDGRIIVVGPSFPGGGFDRDFAVLALRPDGSRDTSFGGSAAFPPHIPELPPDGVGFADFDFNGQFYDDDTPWDVVVQPDGSIVVAGVGGAGFGIAKFTASGRLDSGFGGGDGLVSLGFGAGGTGGVAYAIALTDDGTRRIVVAGESPNDGSDNLVIPVARLNADGSLDASFGGDGTVLLATGHGHDRNGAQAVALDAQGRILLGTSTWDERAGYDFAVARLNADGSLDSTLNGGDGVATTGVGPSSDRGWALALAADGQVLVGGSAATGLWGADRGFMLLGLTSDGRPAGAAGTITNLRGGEDEAYAIARQSDGKTVLAGYSEDPAASLRTDFALVRYASDGGLDSDFGTGGVVYTDFDGRSDLARAVGVQDDGRIVVAGQVVVANRTQIGLARYTTDGRLDAGFDGDGRVATTLGATGTSYAQALALRDDGAILVAAVASGASGNDVAVLRYLPDGRLDSGFDGDGIARIAVAPAGATAQAMAVDAAGRVVVAGFAWNGTNNDVALLRLLPDGALDTGFGGGDGIVTLDLGGTEDRAYAVAVQADGRVVVAGSQKVGTDPSNLLVARFTADGTPDASFDFDGRLVVRLLGDGAEDVARGVAIRPDGHIVVAGHSGVTTVTLEDVVVLRLNPDGSFDTSFGAAAPGVASTDFEGGWDTVYGVAAGPGGTILAAGEVEDFFPLRSWDRMGVARFDANGSPDDTFDARNTLDGAAVHVAGGAPAVLDADVRVRDAELAAAGSYAGATLTLQRSGAQPNPEDLFVARPGGTLGALLEGADLVLDGTAIGTVATNSAGRLVLAFGANATESRVDAAMQQLAYANASATPPSQVRIAWSFDDGNAGAQGEGGALAASGETTVTIEGTNRIDGTPGNDRLSGSSAADSISGYAGNDTLEGFAGDDTLAGGDGVDVAVFAAPRAEVSLALASGGAGSGTGIAVGTGASAPLGSDAFDGIERLKFADAVWALDTRAPGENAYDVVALLHCALGALPPTSELARFLPLADAGADAAALGDAIIAHYAPGLPTDVMVDFLYFQLTGAKAPAEVVAAFASMVGPGLPFPTQGALYAAAAALELNTVRFAGLVADGVALPADWYA